jgi:hypothetical protein
MGPSRATKREATQVTIASVGTLLQRGSGAAPLTAAEHDINGNHPSRNPRQRSGTPDEMTPESARHPQRSAVPAKMTR